MRNVLPKFVGARIERREDPALLNGQAAFVADLPLENALSMALVRSPYAHARIRGIDASRVRSLPGVVAVLAATDVHPRLSAPLPFQAEASAGEFVVLRSADRFPLASDKARFVGDPIAVVVAATPYEAADARDAVVIDYEPLPAVVDPERALADGAPLLYEELETNRGYVWKVEGGDVEGAFSRAETIVELRARIQRLIANPMEPRGVAAVYDPDTEGFTVWSSTQTPHLLRNDLAEMLGVSREAVRVIAPQVGGGFGVKSNVYPEEVLAPFLARELGRPVRWIASRSEDYLATAHGRDQVAVLRLAADADGRLLGADLNVVADSGAFYAKATASVPPLTGLMMTGVYAIPAARAEVTGVFTNKAPAEPYRGAGRPEAAYLIERAMDLLANDLGLDPIEIRKRNFIPPDRFPYQTPTGLVYDSGNYALALAEALRRADYDALREEQARRRREGGDLLGIGVSCYVEICGFGPWETGSVEVGPDGSVVVLTGTSPHGQGHETSWAQIAAEVLQVRMEDVVVRHGDTAVVPRGIGTFGSRSAPVGGSAVYQNAGTVRERAREIAAHLLEAAAADVVLEGGRFHVAGVPARSVGWREVAAAAAAGDERLPPGLRGKLASDDRFEPPGETYPFGAHVCAVEIDRETGEIRILRYATADDCGKVINPLLVEGQVHGGIAQGIGQALWEEAVYDESGNLLTGSLMEYAIPRAAFFPWFATGRTETPTPLNALGVKGVGEAATIGSTPAVANAVLDALAPFGVRHLDTPFTPEKIWRALAASRGRTP